MVRSAPRGRRARIDAGPAGNPPPTLVVGLGNPLMADDGVGPRIIALLQEHDLPPKVRLAVAADSLELADMWRGETRVWLVDAVSSQPPPALVGPPSPAARPGDPAPPFGVPPGTIHRLDHDRVMSLRQVSSSAHHLSLAEGLRWLIHATPEMARIRFRLWGIEAASVRPHPGVHPAVADAAERVVGEIADAVSAHPWD